MDGLSGVTYGYQWIRVDGGDSDISGETSSTYTLQPADDDKKVKVKVSFRDSGGYGRDGDKRGVPVKRNDRVA